MAKLVINPTSASKKEVPIASRVLSIGRDPSNDLVLSDSMVSRRHAILEQRDEEFVLRDNNSSNGTMVNGDRLESEKVLRDGDLVAIGSSRLLFRLDDGSPEPAAPGSYGRGRAGPREAESSSPSVPPRDVAEPGRKCPSCGRGALATDRYCRGCGTELSKGKASVVCPECSAEVLLPAEFCGSCGKLLDKKNKSPFVATRPHRKSELEPEREQGSSKTPAAEARERRVRAAHRRPAAGRASEAETAGFGVRFLAGLVDGMILAVPLLIGALLWGTLVLGRSSEDAVRTVVDGELGLLTSVYVILCGAYFLFFWVTVGATPGKSLLGLQVATEEGRAPIGYPRAVLRLLGYLLSALPLGLGFFWIAVSDDRRALHDKIASTRVTRKS